MPTIEERIAALKNDSAKVTTSSISDRLESLKASAGAVTAQTLPATDEFTANAFKFSMPTVNVSAGTLPLFPDASTGLPSPAPTSAQKLSEGEFNRSPSMQQQYGNYTNYLNGVELSRRQTVTPKGFGADTPTGDSELDKYMQGLQQNAIRANGEDVNGGYAGRKLLGGALESAQGLVNMGGYVLQRATSEKPQVDVEQVSPTGDAELDKYLNTISGNAQKANGATDLHSDSIKLKQTVGFADDFGKRTDELFPRDTLSNRQKIAGDISSGVGGMVPSVLANFIAPGSSLFVMSAGAAGNATTQALNSGADADTAIAYGTAVGLVEAATEKMFDGVAGVFGKGAADDIVESAIKKAVGNETAQKAIMTLAGMLGEGFEEFVSEFADKGLTDLMIGNDGRSLSDTFGDAAYSFLIGSFVSGVVQAANSGVSNITPKQAAEAVKQTIATDIQSTEKTSKSQTAKSESGTLSEAQLNPTLNVTNNTVQNEVAQQTAQSVQVPSNIQQQAGENVQATPTMQTAPVQTAQNGEIAPNAPIVMENNATSPVEGQTIPAEVEAPQSANVNADIPQSVGAAATGFTENGEKGFVPTQNKPVTDSTWMSEDAKNVAAPEEHQKVSNDMSMQGAEQWFERDENGKITNYDEAADNLLHLEEWSGFDEDAAMMLAQEAWERNDKGTFRELMRRYSATGTSSGRTLQARQKWVATPQGKVAQAQEAIDSSKESERKSGRKAIDNGAKKIKDTVNDQVKDAIDVTLNGKEAVGGSRDAQLNVKIWNAENGLKLASSVINRLSGETREPTTALRTIYNDLQKFTNGFIAPTAKAGAPARTATDTLRDYFANRDAYEKAWQTMQLKLRNEAATNPTLNDQLGDILDITSASEGGMNSAAIIKAIILSADSMGISKGDILQLGALGAADSIPQTIADELIKSTNAEGADAAAISTAAKAYVDNIVAEDKSSTRIKSIVGKGLEETGVKLSDLISQNWESKQAMAEALTQHLITKYDLSDADALAATDVIQAEFYNELFERSYIKLEQTFKAKAKSGEKTFKQKFEEMFNLGAFTEQRFKDAAEKKLLGTQELSDDEISQIYTLMQQANEIRATDEYQANLYEANANKIVASKMPKPVKQKVITGLMDAMLGNLKTLISRNAGGNVVFNAVEQTITKANTAIVDSAVSLKTKERYHSMPTPGYYAAYGKGFAKGAVETAKDFKNKVHTPRSGDSFSEATDNAAMMRAQTDVFTSKFANELDRAVKTLLEIGDRPFYEAQYSAKMYELDKLKAKGKMSEQQIKDFNEWAPALAKLTALQSVFQSKGKTAEGMQHLKSAVENLIKGLTGIPLGGQAAIPFTTTPANLLELVSEYVPITGMASNAIQTAVEKHSGNFDQSRFSQKLGRSLTGAELIAAFGALAAAGAVTGGGSNRDDKEILEQSGWQKYSIKIGEHYYSYDWFAVLGPMMAGVTDFYEAEKYGDASVLDSTVTALGSVANQSVLQGLNRLFGGSGNIVSGLSDAMLGLTGQVVPSPARQIAKTTDEYERETYDPNAIKNQWNYIKSGIPGLRETLPVKTDIYGQQMQVNDGRGIPARLAENLLSPGWLSDVTSDTVNDELLRLRDAGQNVSITSIGKSYDIDRDGVNDKLTSDEYTAYKETRGQTMRSIMEQAISCPCYESLTDEQKKQVMETAIDYAGSAAREQLAKGRLTDEQFKKYNNSNRDELSLQNTGAYLVYKRAYTDAAEKDADAADFEALDNVLDNYDDVPEDVQTFLEDETSGFAKLVSANKAGMETQTYYNIKNAISAMPSGTKQYEKFDMISGMGLSDADTMTALKLYGSETTYNNIVDANKAGYKLNDVLNFYNIKSRNKKKAAKKIYRNDTEFDALWEIFS